MMNRRVNCGNGDGSGCLRARRPPAPAEPDDTTAPETETLALELVAQGLVSPMALVELYLLSQRPTRKILSASVNRSDVPAAESAILATWLASGSRSCARTSSR